jgi:hypothetical protein
VTNTIKKAPAVSTAGIIIIICGLGLILSVFLPWIVAAPALAGQFKSGSASAFSVSSLLGLAGVAGGVLAIGFAFLPAAGVKRIVHVLIAVLAIGVFVLCLFNGTLPLGTLLQLKVASIGFGVYIYAFFALILFIMGFTEAPKKAPVMAGNVPAGNVPAGKTPVAKAFVSPPPSPSPAAPRADAGFCTSCGAPLKPGTAFCTRCGAAVAVKNSGQVVQGNPRVFCSNCGKPNPSSSGFCTNCGAPLTN